MRPEHDMGKRVAHLVAGRMDYVEFDGGYAMVKTSPPTDILGQPLRTTEVRKRFRVIIVAIKRPGERFTYATPETVVNRGDVIIASGKPVTWSTSATRAERSTFDEHLVECSRYRPGPWTSRR